MIFTRQTRRNAIKMTGERNASLDLARGRLALMSAFFVLAFMLLAARAADLIVFQARSAGLADNGRVEDSASAPGGVMRADILDRNGVLLATTIKTASLYADPQLIADPEKAAADLAKIFPGMSYGEVLQKLQDRKRFVWIRRSLTPQEQRKVLDIGEPGLAFRYEDRRVYLQGNLAAHLVGYADIDNQGLAGIERGFDAALTEGRPVMLTMDIRLQHALRRETLQAINDFSAHGGIGIIMDVRSGEILGAVSLPDFDPHDAGNADQDKIFNRISLGTYEFGSVFKIFSTAVFLETHNVPMSASFDAREPIKRGRFTINDYHAEKRILTIPEIFMVSSNIGAAMMGEAVGTDRLQKFYADIGLTERMQFELPETGTPQIPQPWREINTLTASYGHGISTTPLQLVAAMSSIVNGGYLVRPNLVLGAAPPLAGGIKGGSGATATKLRVVSPKTAHRLRQLMRLVVTDGTGANAEVAGYNVGGKTGTAEKPGAGGGYDHARLLSSFVGVFPMDDPQYAVFIAVDEPKPNRKSFGYATGGWVAAPAVGRVVASMASILGLPPQPGSNDMADSLKQYVSAVTHD